MIHVDHKGVTIAIHDSPLTNLLMQIDEKALEQAEVVTDLGYLFSALYEQFGKGETATLIELALKHADYMKLSDAPTENN